MKSKNIIYSLGLVVLMGASLSSCDSYLDEMPDNRTELDMEDKIVSLLTSAYPQNSFYGFVNECISDNIDDMGKRYNKYDERFPRQVYNWQDITETDNDGILNLWENSYHAIAAANQALKSIEELGGAKTTKLKEAKAEALLCRAYNHFILVNEFCMNYNTATSTSDMGIPYVTEPESHVYSDYKRGTVAEVYEKINKDIEEALPIMGDTHYSVPKYHFNTSAAYAFAARFNLFYEKWDKAAEYATKCLGSNPKSMLRDWTAMESYGITSDLTPRTNLYIDATSNSNLLLCTAISYMGLWAGNYGVWGKYSHNSYISQHETFEAENIWGASTGQGSKLRCPALAFKGGSMDRVLVAKLPYMFDEKDPVAKTGYFRTVYVPFKADLTLLERAEAYIMLKEYNKACDDLSIWIQNWTTDTKYYSPEEIKAFYDQLTYSTSTAPTMRKHLHPAFNIDVEGSIQESLLQCVLSLKRIETVYEGFRWWDIKRYGINITRRTMNADSEPEHVTDSLGTNDPRRAIQLPYDVIQAGLPANPRN